MEDTWEQRMSGLSLGKSERRRLIQQLGKSEPRKSVLLEENLVPSWEGSRARRLAELHGSCWQSLEVQTEAESSREWRMEERSWACSLLTAG